MSRIRLVAIWYAAIAVLVSGENPSVGQILYVDASQPAGGDGTSWSSAYSDLQPALAAAAASGGAIMEVRVAKGTFRPAPQNGSRSALFILRNGLAIRGGYAGWSELNPDERNVELYESILSGDLNANDGPNFTNRGDNSYHVVGASNVNASAVLDGFTISGGYANGDNPNDRGAGIFLYPMANSPTILNCMFRGNKVIKLPPATQDAKGGAMYAFSSTATFIGCSFESNEADYGGAVYHLQSAPQFIDCTFRDNTAFVLGGAIYNFATNATLDRCLIANNLARAGGGMYNFNSNPVIDACVFQRNSATGAVSSSGGGLLSEPGHPVVRNSIFTANQATSRGGGAYSNLSSMATFVNCAFVGNMASGGGGLAVGGGTTTVSNAVFHENLDASGEVTENAQVSRFAGTALVNYSSLSAWTGALGGVGNGAFAAAFVDVDGVDDTLGTEDDDLRLSSSSECIDVGDPAIVLTEGMADFAGHARVLCGRVDIGPHEFGVGDVNCDRSLTLSDFASWPTCALQPEMPGCESLDYEFDGDVDLRDFSRFQIALPAEEP